MNDFQPTSPAFSQQQGSAGLTPGSMSLGSSGFDITANSPIMPQASPGVPGVIGGPPGGPFQNPQNPQQQFLNPTVPGAYSQPQHDTGQQPGSQEPPSPANMFYSNPVPMQPFSDPGGNPVPSQMDGSAVPNQMGGNPVPTNQMGGPNTSQMGNPFGSIPTPSPGGTVPQPYCSPLAQMMSQVGAMGEGGGQQQPMGAPAAAAQQAHGPFGGTFGGTNQFPFQQPIQHMPQPSYNPMEMQQPMQMNPTTSGFPEIDALFNDADGDFKPDLADSKADELAQIDLDQVRQKKNGIFE